MIRFDKDQMRAVKRIASADDPSPVRSYARAFLAMQRRKGIRFSHEDVCFMFADEAVEQALVAHVQAILDEGSP